MIQQILLVSWTLSLVYGEISKRDDVYPDNRIELAVQKGMMNLMAKFNKVLLRANNGNRNIVFSPINTYEMITSIAAGTADIGRGELCDLLGVSCNIDSVDVHYTLKRLLYLIHGYSSSDPPKINGISWKEGLQLKDWRQYFPVKLNDSNFPGDDIVTELVHAWLPDASQDPSVLKQKLSPVLKVMTSSPMYFHETWKGVRKNLLLEDTFHTIDGDISVKIVDFKHRLPYIDNPTLKYDAIGIPYENEHFSTYIVRPYETRSLSDLADSFDESQYKDLIENLYYTNVSLHVRIPHLRFKWASSINEDLKKLGVNQIFARIIVDEVVHSLQLSMSFETRGAQLSLADFFLPRLPRRLCYDVIAPQMVVTDWRYLSDYGNNTDTFDKGFYVNRPFMFFIYNHDTKLILFSGAVTDPSRMTNL